MNGPEKYKLKFEKLLADYSNILVLGIDNVGSLQMQKVRIALRGKAVLIMGKNTLMRMIIRESIPTNPKLENLLPYIVGNMGLCFTNNDLASIRKTIVEFKTPAAAKSGTTAPSDVYVPPGPTGLDPSQTGFFQALNIATKIVKGGIEIINQVHLIRQGDKVSSSHVALLSKLGILPFFYGIVALAAYESGSVYPVSVLDITQDDLLAKFLRGVSRLTALSYRIGYPSELTLPLYVANAFRKLLAVSLATSYKFPQADEFLKKAASGPAAAAPGKAAPAAAAAGGKDDKGKKDDKGGKKKEKEPEPEEEDDGGFGGAADLFG